MSAGYEKKDVSIRGLTFAILAIVLLIVVFVVLLRGYFLINVEKSITEEVVNNPSLELKEIVDKDNKLLSDYSVLDAERGLYQIPIEKAMELVVMEYKSRQ